jgi:hypothetical protein
MSFGEKIHFIEAILIGDLEFFSKVSIGISVERDGWFLT